MKKSNLKIIKKLGVLGRSCSWEKQVKIVSWYGREKQLDIRVVDTSNGKAEQGIALNDNEVVSLYKILKKYIEDYL